MPAQFKLDASHVRFYDSRIGRGVKHRVFKFVKVGECYVVYAVFVSSGYPHFYVGRHDRPLDWFAIPAPCFEILDARVSRYWCFHMRFVSPITAHNGITHIGTSVKFAFREWIEEKSFFENLVDEKEREVKIMSDYAALMDIEYRQSAIKEAAQTLSDGYFKCPGCGHEWEIDQSNEMARCPECSLVMHYRRCGDSALRSVSSGDHA